jgi:hypothetical protein
MFSMTATKLHINLVQGIIDAEGDESFVWKVYEDFKTQLGQHANTAVTAHDDADESVDVESTPSPNMISKTKARRSTKQSKGNAIGLSGYKPKLVNDLDTSGIKDFIAPYAMTTHPNNIVAFIKFLESKGRKPASFDHVYTCYRDAGIKVPEAFGQAFVDARGKKSFIQFTDPTNVELTIRGANHIEHGGMQKLDKAKS